MKRANLFTALLVAVSLALCTPVFAEDPLTLDIADGSITLTATTVQQGGGEAQDIPAAGLVITGTSDVNTIVADAGAGQTASFTISDLSLSTATGASLIDIRSGAACVTLAGANTLTGGGTGFSDGALLRVADGQALTLAGDGSLSLAGGTESTAAFGAAIGGSAGEDGGDITIAGGTISIAQYGPGAGIGGGGPTSDNRTGDSGTIRITGGVIDIMLTAADNYGGGCGIGPGVNYGTSPSNEKDGVLNTVEISGGTVTVRAVTVKNPLVYYTGAAIGTGRVGAPDGETSLVHITGTARVTAETTGSSAAIGGSTVAASAASPRGAASILIDGSAYVEARTHYVAGTNYAGAAIGLASNNFATPWTISIGGNAEVVAVGDVTGAGIGSSLSSHGSGRELSIEIGGAAKVTALGGQEAAGIGTSISFYNLAQTTSIRISGTANVTAVGGYGAAGIGSGTSFGYYDADSGDITITDSAVVTATGGAGASGIGAGSNGNVAGTTTITPGTTVVAYADGAKFAIDIGTTGSGRVEVTDTVLNGRFAVGEVTPSDPNAADAESPIRLWKDGATDAALTLPAFYRAFAATASDGVGAIRVQNGEKPNLYAYYLDGTAKKIQYPLYEAAGSTYTMTTKDELRWMPAVSVAPADITTYIGGEKSYAGVVDISGGLVTNAKNGFPEPGFYVTLPEDLERELKEAVGAAPDAALNLSDYLSFTDGTRVWTLELYGADSYSTAYGKYLYRLRAAEGQTPVRMQFTDAGGVTQTSDNFLLSDALYSRYEMAIYPGAVQDGTVMAVIDTGKVADPGRLSYTEYAADTAAGTLIVRGVTQQGGTTAVQTAEPSAAVAAVTAVVPEGTKYYVNDSNVQVVNGSPALLADGIVQTQNSETLLKNKALSALAMSASDKLRFEFRYLDLVDASNGNTWLRADSAVTVYWPYPAGTDRNTEFRLVHFDGLDRDMTVADLADRISGSTAKEVSVEKTEYGIRFATDSFSPFALVWEQAAPSPETPQAPSSGTTETPSAPPPAGGTPQTGDSFAPVSLAALMAASAAAAVVLRRRSRRS